VNRRAYLDWLRGFAVLCMIEWHVIDSWTAAGSKSGPLWPIIVTIGGMAAPLFLFLAGLAAPFAIDSHMRRGETLSRAAWLVQKRGWQVFFIAHLFRFQSFLTNPHASWSTLLKPDILNILGLGLAGTAWLVGRLRQSSGGGPVTLPQMTRWLVLPSALILIMTPWSRMWWWPTLLHPRLEAYFRPNGYGVFELFPWAALVPAGALVGMFIARARDEAAEQRFHWRLAWEGAVLAAVGYAINQLPLPASIATWTYFPARIVMQIGWMTFAIWIAWMWMRLPIGVATSGPMLLFGRTSLFVYWLHIELAFGFLSYPLHRALPLGWSVVGFVLMCIAMYFAASWWDSRPKRQWIPTELRASN
jgi:uncharacterized membrane protein